MSNIHWLDFNDAAEQTPEESFETRRERLRSALIGQLPGVLHHLFPSGKIRNGAFKIGGLDGQRGDSLSVTLRGEQAGLWQDFATGEGGDIFDLWAAVHRLDTRRDFARLLDSIENWMGTAPVRSAPPRREPPTDDLGPATARWDYLDTAGNLIACVYRYDTPNGKEFRPWDVKARRHKAPDPRPLYNQPGILKADRIVLVEGEKCADALIAKGICATTAMNGANAPIEKTDWSPLKGKHVLIWPDNDEAGKAYALRAADALRLAGAASVSVLTLPVGKPPKWDAADAVVEGFDIPAFLAATTRATINPSTPIPAFSVGHYLDDDTPTPPDIVAPRILTPGGLLVLGGAPKVGKTDFLLCWMVHMAAGLPFLGMKPVKPLKIFYFQAEIGYHYLRERLKQISFDIKFMPLVRQNLIITPQVRMLLDEKGVEIVREAILRHVDPRLLDIVAIDPLRNVYDGEGENDNTAMLAFLQDRVERLRFLLNPDLGIILAHHTKKISKKMLEEDPFQGLSGAGSLRSFYSTGMILFRPDEQKSLRQLIFELRNGEGIGPKWVDKIDGHWCEMEHHSARLVNKDYGERLDNERRRRHDVILQVLFDEGRKGGLYTPSQFCQAFENKAGLGGKHSIRDRIDVLATKGYIKFNKDATAKSKYGVMCVEGMEVPAGKEALDPHTGEITTPMHSLLPTHFKEAGKGAILPVENPSVWVYQQEEIS